MARLHETEQPLPLIAEPDQPLFAIPLDDGTVRYFMSEEEADAAITDAMIEQAIGLAGAWRDLADEDVEGALERMRHESPPSPPFCP
jgi:hypothetical protein